MRSKVTLLVLLFTMLVWAEGWAQFRIPVPQPRPPDTGDILHDLGVKIPDLRRILEEEPAVSTSFDDAVTGVPFLDNLDPIVTAPMCQLPFTDDGAFIVALPGMYELEARSYCLHAGTYGPGRGEGYLWAPLRGKLAGIIQNILDRTLAHQDIAQDKVQSLIWAIEARAKISEMPAELREVAQVLLTPEEINRLNGGALGMIPEELFDQAFVDLPDEVRMILEAEARLRERLQQEIYDFEALQAVAVLTGDPEPEEGGPVVPLGRWSWTPEGFFVRFFPHGYSQTTVQLYAPEAFTIVTDEVGRIAQIVNRYGATIELRYADAEPVAVEGDDNVAAYALAAVRLLTADGRSIEVPCSADDLVLAGLPSGRGRIAGAGEALYDTAVETLRQVRDLVAHVEGAATDDEHTASLMNLAHLCSALAQLAENAGDDTPSLDRWVNMARMAWASELSMLLGGEPVGETATAVRPLGGVRLALLPPGQQAMLADAGVYSTWLAPHSNPGRRLPRFQPSRGTATPANRGRQRLGLSGASHRKLREFKPFRESPEEDNDDNEPSGGDGKQAYNRAKEAIGWIQGGKDVVDVVTDPVGTAAGKVGFGVPDTLFGKILDFIIEKGGEAAMALGSDPPRDDFDQIATPEPIILPELPPEQALSPEHAAALNALAKAWAENLSVLRAAQITRDRLGGALAAGDEDWAARQAAALVDYKRQAGLAMIEIAYRMHDVLDAIEAVGIRDIFVTPQAYAAYQQRLRTEGFNAEELQAAQIVGLTEEELQQILEDRLTADPNEMAGSLLRGGRELADAIGWLGRSWSHLPARVPRFPGVTP